MNDGDGSVQDGLVNMIGLQIGQAHVSTYFEDQSDRLRATAEQVCFGAFTRRARDLTVAAH
jgi:hypothetical protein